jgi:hypothetical protein
MTAAEFGRIPAVPGGRMPENTRIEPAPPSPRRPRRLRRRRVRRILLFSALATVLLLAALFFLAPVIAGRVAPGYAQRAIGRAITGKARVERTRFSWWGTQHLGPIVITDQSGAELANLQLDLKRGLLALLGDLAGSRDLDVGSARLSGTLRLVRDERGRTNLESLLKPAQPQGPSQTTIPRITAVLDIDSLDVTFLDQAKAAAGLPGALVHIPALAGQAGITEGRSLSLTLGADVRTAAAPGGAESSAGSFSINGQVNGFADGAGQLTLASTVADLAAEATDLSPLIPDTLAGLQNRLAGTLGERLRAELHASGSLKNSESSVRIVSRSINADLGLRTTAGVLTNSRAGAISISGPAIAALAPSIARALAAHPEQLEIATLPGVSVSLSQLRVPLLNTRGLDLREATIMASAETTALAGRVSVLGPAGEKGPLEPFQIAPVRIALSGAGIGQNGLRLTAQSRATISGRPAGELNVDVKAADLLDPLTGAPREAIPGNLDAVVELRQLATAIAEPLARSAGLRLAEDVGPVVDLTLHARTRPAAPASAEGSLPGTALHVDLASANIVSSADLVYDGLTLRALDQGVRAQIQKLGPLASRLLQKQKIDVTSAGPLAVEIPSLAIDLRRLRTRGATDFGAIAGEAHITAAPSAGMMPLPSRAAAHWTLEPVVIDVDASDLARGVAFKASTAGTLEGRDAGALDVDLVASNLLSSAGAFNRGMPVINGRAVLANVATEIAQPLVESLGLNLPAGIGPRLDVRLTAAAKPPEAGGTIPTDLDFQVRSRSLTADGAITLEAGTIRSRAGGLSVTLSNPGTLLGPAANDGGVSISDGGAISLKVTDLNIPVSRAGGAFLDQASANAQLSTGGYSLRALPGRAPGQVPGALPPPADDPVEIQTIVATLALRPGAPAVADLRGTGAHRNAAFYMKGHVEAPGLGTPTGPRPLGSIELGKVPTSLLTLATGLTGDAAQRPDASQLDTATLMREVIGPALTLTLAAERPAGAPEAHRALSLKVESAGLNGGARAALTQTALTVNEFDFSATMSQALAARFADALGSQLASSPTIEGPGTLRVTATPLTIPLSRDKPDLAAAGPATITVALPGRTMLREIAFVQKDGPPRQVGPVGIQDLSLTLTTDIGILAGRTDKPLPSDLKLSGAALGPKGNPFATVQGSGKVAMVGLQPVNDLVASLSLDVADGRVLDALLNERGLVADGFGEKASVRAGLRVEYPQPDALPTKKGQPPSPVKPWTDQFIRAELTTTIDATKVKTAQPAHVVMLQDRLVIEQPLILNWRMEPAWANWYLLQAGSVQEDQTEQAQFTGPADVTLSIFKMTLSTGKNAGLMQPDIFALDVQLATTGASMSVAGQPATFKNMLTRLTAGRAAGTIGYALRIEDAGGGKPADGVALNLRGTINSIADARGNPTFDKGLITAAGEATGFPTPLIDAIARQDGVITEALGPLTHATITAQSVSRTGGNLTAVLDSDRAEARVVGTINNGAFIQNGATTVRLKEITPELGARFTNGNPLIGRFEKSKDQAPAVITCEGLTIPLDKDFTKFNGTLVFDLGEARFAASTLLGKLVKTIGQPGSGEIGRRLQPFTVKIRAGVATYDRFSLPLGEFTLDTSGSVDLVNKSVDLVTYVPFGAVTDEIAGVFNTGLGSLLGSAIPTLEKATMVPIRITGPFKSTRIRPDPGLLVRNLGASLRPDRLIGGTIKDFLDKLGGNRGEGKGGGDKK